MGKLEVFYNSTKISERVENFMDDAYEVASFAQNADFIYLGYYKPINAIYLELSSEAPARGALKFEYWNGSAWTTLSKFRDDTRGLERSGFVSWERELPNQAETTYESIKQYWWRISITSDSIADLDLKGINLVFSDDRDMLAEFPSVMEYKSQDVASFVGFHQAARDEIISDLRNHGKKINLSSGLIKKIDQFDLMDHEEVRQASKFKAMEKLFFFLSDADGDKYSQRQAYYKSKYEFAKQQAFLTLDKDNDGKTEPQEQTEGAFQTVRVIRE